MKRLFPIVLAVILSACTSTKLTVEENYHEIANYSFTGFFGGEYAVSDFEGRIVILDFWETWCGPCLVTFPGFQRAMNEFPDKIMVLAATPGWSNTAIDVARFALENDYDFIYVDGREMARKLEIRGIPYKIIFAPDGSLISHSTGTRGADAEYRLLAALVEEHFGSVSGER